MLIVFKFLKSWLKATFIELFLMYFKDEEVMALDIGDSDDESNDNNDDDDDDDDDDESDIDTDDLEDDEVDEVHCTF